jgi:prefoldin subunit 5
VSKSISELSEATTLGSNFYFPVADTDTVNNYKVSIDTIKNHIKNQLESGNDYLNFKNINSISGNKLVITVIDNNNRYIAESNITISELDIYKNLNNKLDTTIAEITKAQEEISSFNDSIASLNSTYTTLKTTLDSSVKTTVLNNSALKNYYNKTATKNCVAQFKGGYLAESDISIESLQSTNDESVYNELKNSYDNLKTQYDELKGLYDGLKQKLGIS